MLVAVLLAGAAHGAVAPRLDGSLSLRSALDEEDVQRFELEAQGALRWDLGRRCRAFTEARVRIDNADLLEPGRPQERAARSALTQRLLLGDHAEVDLREATLECTYRKALLRVGKQETVWGQADGLKVLDVVNPQSFREFLSEDFDASRIPLWSANVELLLNDSTTLQLLWIADATGHQFPEAGALFSFSSPFYDPLSATRQVLDGSAPWAPEALGALSLSAIRTRADSPLVATLDQLGVSSLDFSALSRLAIGSRVSLETSRPTSGFDYGFRLQTRWGGWDLALHSLRHIDPVPVFSRRFSLVEEANEVLAGAPSATLHVQLNQSYQRTRLHGLSFANAFGSWVLRGEIAWTPDKQFQVLDLDLPSGLARGEEVAGVIGLDWRRDTSFLSWQFFQTNLGGVTGLTPRGLQTRNVTGLYQRELGALSQHRLRLLWAHDVDRDDGWLQLRTDWELVAATKIEVGAEIFYGDADGLFGQFGSRDRLLIGLRRSW